MKEMLIKFKNEIDDIKIDDFKYLSYRKKTWFIKTNKNVKEA